MRDAQDWNDEKGILVHADYAEEFTQITLITQIF